MNLLQMYIMHVCMHVCWEMNSSEYLQELLFSLGAPGFRSSTPCDPLGPTASPPSGDCLFNSLSSRIVRRDLVHNYVYLTN